MVLNAERENDRLDVGATRHRRTVDSRRRGAVNSFLTRTFRLSAFVLLFGNSAFASLWYSSVALCAWPCRRVRAQVT